MAIKPELLQKDTTAADSDLIMKTDSSNVTKTITAGNFFTWLWSKIKGSTKSTLDPADPTAPVNTSAVNGALTEQQTIKAININSDVELWNYLVNIGRAKTGSININYESSYFANSYGSFIYTVGPDPNMINGYFSKLYDNEKYYVLINICNREIFKKQLATKSDLTGSTNINIACDHEVQEYLRYSIRGNIAIVDIGGIIMPYGNGQIGFYLPFTPKNRQVAVVHTDASTAVASTICYSMLNDNLIRFHIISECANKPLYGTLVFVL